MAFNIGDKIGSYLIENVNVDPHTGQLITEARCTLCGDKYTFSAGEDYAGVIMRAHNCTITGINPYEKLYVGQKVGSYVITDIVERVVMGVPLYDITAKCTICQTIARGENFQKPQEFANMILPTSCKFDFIGDIVEEDEDTYEIFKNYPTKIQYYMNRDQVQRDLTAIKLANRLKKDR